MKPFASSRPALSLSTAAMAPAAPRAALRLILAALLACATLTLLGGCGIFHCSLFAGGSGNAAGAAGGCSAGTTF
ncbi:MAG: hypothetical protein LBV61_00390 [Burkholderiaceae bacterium]|nr:hypothetical protein [Burkholderiaceae bacterium]